MSKLTYLAARVRGMHFDKMKQRIAQVQARSGRSKARIFLDMAWCGLRYQAGYIDYAIFGMENLSTRQRATLLTRGKNNEYVAALNQRADWHFFDSKKDFLKLFSAEAGREFLDLAAADEAAFAAFAGRHPVFFAKDDTGLCGSGILRVETGADTDLAALRAELIAGNRTTLEQPIVQHPALSALYPGAINTVRMMTLRGDDGTPHIVFACLRVGRGGSYVDNFNAGGMTARVDLDTGRLRAPALNKAGDELSAHPDTGVAFEGFEIPFYDDCRALVLAAARKVEGIQYVGWDVAVTPDGPVLVEGNHFPGHDVTQLAAQTPEREGLLPVFDRIVPYRSLSARRKANAAQ